MEGFFSTIGGRIVVFKVPKKGRCKHARNNFGSCSQRVVPVSGKTGGRQMVGEDGTFLMGWVQFRGELRLRY